MLLKSANFSIACILTILPDFLKGKNATLTFLAQPNCYLTLKQFKETLQQQQPISSAVKQQLNVYS